MTYSNLTKIVAAGALGTALAAGSAGALARSEVEFSVGVPATTVYTDEYVPPPAYQESTTTYYSDQPGVTVYYHNPAYVDHYYYEHHRHWWHHDRD